MIAVKNIIRKAFKNEKEKLRVLVCGGKPNSIKDGKFEYIYDWATDFDSFDVALIYDRSKESYFAPFCHYANVYYYIFQQEGVEELERKLLELSLKTYEA